VHEGGIEADVRSSARRGGARAGRGAPGGRSGAGLLAVGSDGKTYTLSQFKGKKAVVLAWFPKAFTSGCTVECKSLAANGDKLRQYEVAYFMASVDAVDGEKGNKAFAESEKADFPILSDPTKEVATAYGVVHPERGFAHALDLLHRQGRQDRGDRQGREAADLGRGRDRAARRPQGPRRPTSAKRRAGPGTTLMGCSPARASMTIARKRPSRATSNVAQP
jgi:peroxiredoxin